MYLSSNKHSLCFSISVKSHTKKKTTTDYICKSKPLFVVKSEYLHSFVFLRAVLFVHIC